MSLVTAGLGGVGVCWCVLARNVVVVVYICCAARLQGTENVTLFSHSAIGILTDTVALVLLSGIQQSASWQTADLLALRGETRSARSLEESPRPTVSTARPRHLATDFLCRDGLPRQPPLQPQQSPRIGRPTAVVATGMFCSRRVASRWDNSNVTPYTSLSTLTVNAASEESSQRSIRAQQAAIRSWPWSYTGAE